jgi:hypothetical protein
MDNAIETVVQFEKHHNITLPDDYRRFILQAGNGGAGPHYGLLPLENIDHEAGLLTE